MNSEWSKLCGDEWDNIMSYSAWIEKSTMAHTCRYFADRVGDLNELLRRIIVQKLERFVTTPRALLECIDKHNIAISGSFMLECLYDEKWRAGDLDLYGRSDVNWYRMRRRVPTADAELFRIEIEERGNVRAWNDPVDAAERGGEIWVRHFISDPNRNCIMMPNIEMQVIAVQDEDVLNYIGRSFDMNICKVAYKNGRLNIFDINDVRTRRTAYRRTMDNDKYVALYDDYKFDDYRGLIQKRIDKYRARGFDIDTVDYATEEDYNEQIGWYKNNHEWRMIGNTNDRTFKTINPAPYLHAPATPQRLKPE
jgi:hypothetical protein